MIVLSGNDISVSFGGETLFHDVNFRLEENGRAGLVGVNGCGKTTLMHVINGRQEAETGGISKAAGIKIGCMEQYVIRDDNITLYDEVLEIFRPLIDAENELADIAVAIDTGDHSEQTLSRQMQLQERFEREGGLTYKSMTCSALVGLGFSEEDFGKPISVMSGGQKSKAQLAKLLLSGSNILLLDEPTNHLDITACEWLEKFLTEYKGAYIVISHDRYFLDKVTDTTFEMENRTLREYKGNYTRYLELKAEAREAQQRVYDRTVKEINALEDLAKLLGLPKIPTVIESYDISNLGEDSRVGGMIVYRNGRPYKAGYRKFTIKNVIGQNDYACMQEVLQRRIQRYLDGDESFAPLPDLILLDGGKGHVHAVQQVLDSMNVSIPLYGLVKDDKHRTRAIAAQGEEIQINANRKLFSLMTNIQDEVHRFSLSFQQQTHKKKTYELELTKIKGIGEAKALALIKHFKTKQALKDASPDEIASVAKVKEEKAIEIYDFIKENF